MIYSKGITQQYYNKGNIMKTDLISYVLISTIFMLIVTVGLLRWASMPVVEYSWESQECVSGCNNSNINYVKVWSK
jgi:TRAP-type mannitol/chloroaromatic compound transport system permease small subunit